MKPITIILTNRNTLEFLKIAVNSIKKNQSADHELIIMDDNSSDGSKEWLEQHRKPYNFKYFTHTDKERHGIVGMVDEGVVKALNEIVFIGHSDMYYGKDWEKNLIKHLDKKTVVCSTRVEPPIHPPEPCKVLHDCGNFPEEFKEDIFEKVVIQIQEQRKDVFTRGVFAPVMVYKKDWIGHDQLFYPQSIEDSDLWYRMSKQGYKFIQSWDSVVYHFTSRGSRFNNETKKTLQSSQEWKQTNKKNLKNFIRRYGNTPQYTQTKLPIVYDKVPISAHVLAYNGDVSYVYDFLNMVEPYFDELVFVVDEKPEESIIEKEIEKYCVETENSKPNNFNRSKIKVFHRPLNMDFAGQTNFAISKCTNDWTMKLDLDEMFNETFLNMLPRLAQQGDQTGVLVFGFPRINTLDGVVVNDIPRDQWTVGGLSKYPKPIQNQKLNLQNPDYQFRLHKQNVKWVGDVHEVPELVRNTDKKRVVVTKIPFNHVKTLKRQTQQNKFYDTIVKEPIKKIIYDSVLFTTEGITKHAREEILELNNKGYHVQCLDWYKYNDKITNCKKFTELYTPIDIMKKDYMVICNQPPSRWGKTLGLKNFIGFLAFEGKPPQQWVKAMNNPQVTEIWTPSTYCQTEFKKAGVTKPVHVIPHGINPNIWKPLETKENGKFTFLWVGTTHNPRKGDDLVLKAFNEEFANNTDVQLVLKVNKIYNKNVDVRDHINKHISKDGNVNICYVDEDLTESEMVQLFNQSDVFVSPHRSEGFGINILQALSVGLPVIATKHSGNMDFCTTENTWFIDVKEMRYAPFIYPYLDAKWAEPCLHSLKKQMRHVYENYSKCKEKASVESKKIREKWTWKNTINKIETRIQTL